MRAALLHLRLLTLPADKIFHQGLGKYLSNEERIFLGCRLFNTERPPCDPIPPTLCPIDFPRNEADFCRPNTLELIPEHLIVTDFEDIAGQNFYKSGLCKEVFCIEFEVLQNLILKGIEILTQAEDYPMVVDCKDKSNR